MISFKNVTFNYPNLKKPALSNLSLHIPAGEFVLLVGVSGAGKSTFLRCLNGLVPHFSGGVISGQIRVAKLDPVNASPKQMSREVGFVFQDPESQFVMDIVEDDVAFTLENAGISPSEIHKKLDSIFTRLKIEQLRRRKIQTLSGGERQKVAIASALVLSPQILALDEPTSQLDPYAAYDILETIVQLKQELSLTVLISEHRLERLLPYADRLIYFDPVNEKVYIGKPTEVLPFMPFHPPVISLGLHCGWRPLPLSIQDARSFVHTHSQFNADKNPEMSKKRIPEREIPHRVPVVHLQDVSVNIGQTNILDSIDLNLYKGEILALMGPNGAGKTTILRVITGLQKPAAGKLSILGKDITSMQTTELCLRIGIIPQDPNLLLFADKVIDELLITLRNHNLPADQGWIKTLLSQLGIFAERERYPRDLSVGQRQRVALGAILVTKPDIILLDEPTRGMDMVAKQALVTLLAGWRSQGKSILLVTHDVELVANCGNRIIMLKNGRVASMGSPKQILPELGEFAPQITQLFPGKGWLNEKDVLHHYARASSVRNNRSNFLL